MPAPKTAAPAAPAAASTAADIWRADTAIEKAQREAWITWRCRSVGEAREILAGGDRLAALLAAHRARKNQLGYEPKLAADADRVRDVLLARVYRHGRRPHANAEAWLGSSESADALLAGSLAGYLMPQDHLAREWQHRLTRSARGSSAEEAAAAGKSQREAEEAWAERGGF